MEQIKDSGNRRQFESGAVRDIEMGKGRCDLLPLKQVYQLLVTPETRVGEELNDIAKFMESGNPCHLYTALWRFSSHSFGCGGYDNSIIAKANAILEVAIHYELGALKYEERNWEKGISLHSFIDSGVRHFLKHLRGDKDERHDRAFVWNILGALWTIDNKPECIDIPSVKEFKEND